MRLYANSVSISFLVLLLGLPYCPGYAQQKDLRVLIDLALQGVRIGQIQTMITEEGDIYLPLEELKLYLKDQVNDEVWNQLPGSTREGWIELSHLPDSGLEAAFDRQLLALNISIPPELRVSSEIVLSGTPAVQDPVTHFPSRFSAYMNINSSASVWYESYADDPATFPLYITLAPVVNYEGWVFEAGISAETYPDTDLSFEYERLLRDVETHSLRFTVGTLGVFVQGFQSPYILEGFSLVRDPALFRKERMLSEEELFLERPGTVQVYVNDQLIRTLTLEPGRHRLLNFPYVSGVNDVRILVQEENAPERTLYHHVSFDGRMQPKGDYTYNLGGGIPRWDSGNPVVQGSFLWGFTPWFTGGVNLQGNPDRQLGGVEALFAVPMGILLSDAAVSFRQYTAEDWGGALKYRISFPGRQGYPMVGVGVQYRGRKFQSPSEPLDALPPPSWELSGILSQPFSFGLHIGITASYQFAREGENRIFGSLTILQSIKKGMNLLFSFSSTHSESGDVDTRGTLSFTISSPEGRRTSSFTSNLWEDTASASVQVRPKVSEGTLVVDGAVEGFPLEEERPAAARVSASYGNRFFEGSLMESVYKGSSEYASNRLTGQFRTSIAYAEGVWAFSKPIYDSFALVVPTQSLEREILYVSSTSGGDLTATRKAPGLLLLNSYEKTRLLIDAPQAPPGYEVGESVRVLRPTYRSGTVVRAGTFPTVYVEGTLLFEDGTPVAYKTGNFILIKSYAAQAEAGKKFSFFTDEAGVFQAYSLIPGEYEVQVLGAYPPLTVSIPPENTGFVSLGILKITE